MSAGAGQRHRRRVPLRERLPQAWRIPADCRAAHATLVRARLQAAGAGPHG